MKVIDCSERRIKSRHKAPDLKIKVKGSGLKAWFAGATKANCIDINRYGMAFESSRAFARKERVFVAFNGKYISQTNVPALVTQCIPKGGAWRVSLRFAYALDSEQYCRKMDNALSRIEGLYHPKCQHPQSDSAAKTVKHNSKHNL